MKRKTLYSLVASALCLSLCYLLPFVTGQIPEIGKMLCPMHLPVLLCGFLCGWPWGLAVGCIAPVLRSLTLGAPVLFPSALCMAFELGAYGFFAGLLYRILPKKRGFLYLSLLLSMILGRLVWGGAMTLCLTAGDTPFTLSAFWAGAVTTALPGIAIQILLVPLLVMALEKSQKHYE